MAVTVFLLFYYKVEAGALSMCNSELYVHTTKQLRYLLLISYEQDTHNTHCTTSLPLTTHIYKHNRPDFFNYEHYCLICKQFLKIKTKQKPSFFNLLLLQKKNWSN